VRFAGFLRLCSAGVNLSNFGPYTAVIVLSLLFGKTLGIGIFAQMLVKMGFPLPPDFSMKGAWLVGLVNSVGLTVALFVAGEAFRKDEEEQVRSEVG
jgi:NhaA family Na+:H+ antiporter